MSNEPKLISLADRVARLQKQIAEAQESIKEVYEEARSIGYEPKILKRAIRISMMSESDRKKHYAEQEVLDLYLSQMSLPL